MTWDAVGAIGEIVGAAAVVVTLFFLLAQLRQNTRALNETSRLAREEAANRNYTDLSRWRELIIRDPEIAALWHSGLSGSELSKTDAERFMQLQNEFFFGLWRGYESAEATGNEDLKLELVRVAAAYANSPVMASQFRFFAANPTFEAFAKAVVDNIDKVDPSSIDSRLQYESYRNEGV